MSTVVYRTQCADWNPENFAQGIPAFDSLDKAYHTLNPQENTLVIVTTRRVSVDDVHTAIPGELSFQIASESLVELKQE